MNIVFVVISVRPYLDKYYFPMGPAYVATALKNAGYEFDVIDIESHRYSEQELEDLLGRKPYDVVLMGAMVSGYKYIKKVAEIARRTNPAAVIVAGNSVASSIHEHLLTHTAVDVAVKGEGDITTVKLLRAIEKKIPFADIPGIAFLDDERVVDTSFEEIIDDLDSIPLVDWEIFDMPFYLSKAIQDVPEPYPLPKEQLQAFVVNTARGCPFRCTFCYHVFQYTKYRHRSPHSILKEITALQERYGVNYINFFDELTFFSKEQADEFAAAVFTSGLKFFWNADIRGNMFSEDDLDLLTRLKEAGCLSFGYSLESANEDILRHMNKKITVDGFKRQKRALDKAGITSFTSLVLGYPEETPETLKETFDVCHELNIYPSVGYLLPQPGTPMYDAAREKGAANDMEAYLMRMGDRQDLRYNLTDMPDTVFEGEVRKNLKRISEKIGLNLNEEQLVKTFNFFVSKDE